MLNEDAKVFEAQTLLRAIGRELRAARKRRGWTRKDLLAASGIGMSEQTLASYEQGTRQCTVYRFVQIAQAVGEDSVPILSRAVAGLLDRPPTTVIVNLAKVTKLDVAELAPLRKWARARLDADGRTHLTALNPAALKRLGELCHVEPTEIVRHLVNTSCVV